mmetsp:Transcript_3760/g.9089  ORF Transcript_3760/g.9089 Transcript_3760/m.9089 type:complete len:105 (-) Transcript_3760:155-469(-)
MNSVTRSLTRWSRNTTNTQIKGIDYFRKYSHAVSLETLRLFLAKCIMARLRVTEADYTTAYLNARLDTKIYMKQAEGFEERDENGDHIQEDHQRRDMLPLHLCR